mgnify:CR=1 FL=1
MTDIFRESMRAYHESVAAQKRNTSDKEQNKNEEPIGESDITPEMISEATIVAIYEAAHDHAMEIVKQYLTESGHELVRDGLLTENAMGQSFVVLSRESQRSKAERLLRMQMARKAGDPRYFKIASYRRKIKQLTREIHNDSRYNEARTIVMKRQFRYVPDPKALAAKRTQGAMRLM